MPVVERPHPVAAGGFASAAPDYARSRPAYARAAVGALKESLAGRPTLDVAAGTGILTGQLHRARVPVTALEPVEEMRHQLVRSLPEVPLVAGIAERLPFAGASFGGVVVGEAFHWFDASSALDEAARVLAPGGVLGLAWNRRDESVPWVAAYGRIVLTARPEGRPYPHLTPWLQVVGSHGAFEAGTLERFDNPRPCSPAALVARAASTSFVATAPPERRAAVLEAVRELCATDPDLGGRARFDLPYVTELYRWTRRS